jgi:hypothetical protein
VEDQFPLARARAVEMTEQLQFSFKLDLEDVVVGQAIFFTATFTNTTDHSIVLREPKQYGVYEFEFYDTTLLFSVKPIGEDISIEYPGQGGFMNMLNRKVLLEDFVELPHLVSVKDASTLMWSAEYLPLPVGQYQVQLTYISEVIGYEVRLPNDLGFVDLNSWVGRIAPDPVLLTVTP